jgi:hypothetical protein
MITSDPNPTMPTENNEKMKMAYLISNKNKLNSTNVVIIA